MTLDDLETFFSAYVECALWSSTDESDESGGDPLDQTYGPEDLDQNTMEGMRADCTDFVEANLDDLADMDPEHAGHDFWLTRNGHGAGFWDRGLGELGERLSKASKPYGEVYLYVHDGKVFAS